MAKRYSVVSKGFSWFIRDAETGFESLCDDKAMAVRMVKQLNERNRG